MSNAATEYDYATGSYTVIYAYTLDTPKHRGHIKIGDTTLSVTNDGTDINAIMAASTREPGTDHYTSPEIEAAAHSRIKDQTATAGMEYTLLWCSLAAKLVVGSVNTGARWVSFRDHELHERLTRSGIKRVDMGTGAKEWFKVDLETVKAAFTSVQHGTPFRGDSFTKKPTITLRDEQQRAVTFTKAKFKDAKQVDDKGKERHVLWNAIMRFGKTLATYGLVKKSKHLKKVLIITHRPVVEEGWFEDHGKMLSGTHAFGGRKLGAKWSELEGEECFVQFVSIQSLRRWVEEGKVDLSEAGDLDDSIADTSTGTASLTGDTTVPVTPIVTLNSDGTVGTADNALSGISESDIEIITETAAKMRGVYGTEWDLVVVDESHDGTTTALASSVRSRLKSPNWLHLSGTPFNLMDDFDPSNVYTWDYVQECQAKEQWELNRPGIPSPYANLPYLEILTIKIPDANRTYAVNNGGTANGYFNFNEFFKTNRVRTAGNAVGNGSSVEGDTRDGSGGNSGHGPRFIHQGDVLAFLDQFKARPGENRNFPFDSHDLKKHFAHSFWLIPTVEACYALEALLAVDPFFGDFAIANVAGSGLDASTALSKVQAAVKQPYSITLSVGRLTTGVTVPEWTAVFMLANTRSPMLYLQTIFRAKSSGVLPDGRIKERGYVFDFAPDRALEMVTQAAVSVSGRIENSDEGAESAT